MSHFDPERYSRLSSPVHLWEPRARTLSLFLLICCIAMAGSLRQAAVGLLISLVLVNATRFPLGHVLRFMRWPAIFLLPLAVILPFTGDAGEIASLPLLHLHIPWSSQGVYLGLLFLIRGLGASLVAMVLVGAAPFTVTIQALYDLGLPSTLSQIFLFAYRYVFLLNEELMNMGRSMSCKGFMKRSDLRTAQVLAMSMTMLFIRSYERAEAVYLAMLSRGYQGEFTSSGGAKIDRSDFVKGLMVLAAALSISMI